MSQGIYRITNLINGREYIGQSVNIETRWHKHISSSKNKKDKSHNYPLPLAMRKYGLENFKFEILELVPDKSVLLKKEKYYYDLSNHYYNQEYPQPYVKSTGKPVYQIDMKTLEVVGRFDSCDEAMRSLPNRDKNGSSILKVCKRKTYSAIGYFWCFEKDYTKDWKPIKYTRSKKILQYSLDGQFIKEHNSIIEASKEFNINYRTISACLTGVIKTSAGYVWRYKEVKV